ncbi:ribosomal protein S18 acetylase RimI-like enzyme [Phyllobacterium ifriqiyense]|uniref:Ribosomal protein S18 acetylase RimI-like enzyme n=1 Tax=Phyllobacterium ifriqiyense TaxID=314238 RepID=A0ABU0S5T1_9HYPH|nr:GNAT family N-acetyltransferase [Phyllobacterium ifriqiyense]MDQ0996107.1 ribosomal protein S18 acetylase RimI-like enzyme [Phyllobacterium ifriqiyense]
MSREISIRDATSDDQNAITALHIHVSQQAYAGMLPETYLADILPDEKANLWHRRLSQGIDPARLCLTLAFSNDGLAGFSCFLLDEEKEFGTYLHNLYVNPAHRGKGVACSLLTASIGKFSLQRRIEPIHLLTLAANYPARHFYEKLNGHMIAEKRNVMARYPEVVYVRYQWPSAQKLEDVTRNMLDNC